MAWPKEGGVSGLKPTLTLSLGLEPLARSTSAALYSLVGNALSQQVSLASPSPQRAKLREAAQWGCFFELATW